MIDITWLGGRAGLADKAVGTEGVKSVCEDRRFGSWQGRTGASEFFLPPSCLARHGNKGTEHAWALLRQ